MKILIIEDDNAIRESMRELLLAEWPAHEVLEATNGAEGIESAILERPALIIVDGELPILTGFQLVFLLRQMKSTRQIPLLSITGADPQIPVVKLMIESCDAYLPKPFMVPALLTAVGRLLDMASQDRK